MWSRLLNWKKFASCLPDLQKVSRAMKNTHYITHETFQESKRPKMMHKSTVLRETVEKFVQNRNVSITLEKIKCKDKEVQESDPKMANIEDETIVAKSGEPECPCGYLHGPGDSHHDMDAVGFTSYPLLRGPE